MIIDCLADAHGHYPELEGGDLLIVAGDLTAQDSENEYMEKLIPWFLDNQLKYKKTIWIAGNHDNWVEKHISPDSQLVGAEYLCDSGTEFEGLRIWGSPWTKSFPGMNPKCKAFTLDTEEELFEKFYLIPVDTDILITHSPPHMILDELTEEGKHGGSTALLSVVQRIRPRLHVFGHIHEAYGKTEIELRVKDNKTIFVNASHVNEYYESVNKPIRVIL